MMSANRNYGQFRLLFDDHSTQADLSGPIRVTSELATTRSAIRCPILFDKEG